MKNSPKRLLLVAVSVLALALVVTPVSFAGEDDDMGPTQAGETQGPIENSPATSQGPAEQNAPSAESNSDSNSNSNRNSGSANRVLGATRTATENVKTTKTRDVVQATGGVQAGFGGMANQSGSLPMTLAGALGLLLIAAAAATFVPLRLRSQS